MPAPTAHDLTALAARARVGLVVDGRWRIDSIVAIGGSSAIYAARHRNGMRLAMKVLDADLRDNQIAVSHFLREGRAVNGITHPGVVPVLDEGRTPDGAPFLLMPLLEGETAQQRVARHPDGLPVREALGIVDAVLDILAAAHDAGVVHRDLKPDNVFLERGGAVRVLDFGIARMTEPEDGLELTQIGTVVGTVGYLPPEQARGRVRDVGPRSDLWSVGATLYTLLTGRVLHEAPHLLASIVRAQNERVPPAHKLVPGVSDAVAHVLDGALAFEPGNRWRDAGAMRRAVQAALEDARANERSCAGVEVDALRGGSPSEDPVALDPARVTRRPLAWMAAVCLAAAWIVVAVAIHGHRVSARAGAAAALPVVSSTAVAWPPPTGAGWTVGSPPADMASAPTPPPVATLAPLPADRASASTPPVTATAARSRATKAKPEAAKKPGKASEIVHEVAF